MATVVNISGSHVFLLSFLDGGDMSTSMVRGAEGPDRTGLARYPFGGPRPNEIIEQFFFCPLEAGTLPASTLKIKGGIAKGSLRLQLE
jgi:hypothetical protein